MAPLRATVISHAPRTVRHPVPRPAPQCLGKGVLSAFLGQIPVTRLMDQGRVDASPLLAENIGYDFSHDVGRFLGLVVGSGYSSVSDRNGRTSTRPARAIGCLAATSMASSRSAHS